MAVAKRGRRRSTRRGAAAAYRFCVGALVASAAFAGCSDTKVDLQRVPVEGSVTLDGGPLPKALITFIPTGDTKGPRASGEIVNGVYAIAADHGPCLGEFVVKIETISEEIEALAAKDHAALRKAAAGEKRAMIAPEFNRSSRLRAKVTEQGPNRFDFAVEALK
jgi:hypothetical protein